MRSRFASGLLAMACLAGPGPTAMAAPGDLDPSFSRDGRAQLSATVLESASAVQVDSAGRVLVGWREPFEVSRLRPDGGDDTSFGTGGTASANLPRGGWLNALALDPAGRVLMAGSAEENQDLSFPVVTRLTPDGSPDTGFGAGGVVRLDSLGRGSLTNVAAAPDGSIVVIGSADIDEERESFVARLRPDGSLDPGFADNGVYRFGIAASSWPASIAVGPDGSVTAGVAYDPGTPGAGMAAGALRLTAAGTPDPAFGIGGVVFVTGDAYTYTPVDLELVPGGGVLVAAIENLPPRDGDRTADVFAAMLRADGTVDPSFGVGGYAYVDIRGHETAFDIEPRSGGGWAVTGHGGDQPYDFELAALTAAGKLDRSFSGDGRVSTDISGVRSDDFAESLAVGPDGRIVLAGGADGREAVRPGSIDGPSLVRYLDSPGRADADADRVPDARDACPGSWGRERRGCRVLAVRKVRIHFLPAIDDFRGSVFYAPAYRCSRGSVVKVYAMQPGRDRLVGKSDKARTSRGTWDISSLAPPGRYYARVVPRLVPDIGFCAGGTSATIRR